MTRKFLFILLVAFWYSIPSLWAYDVCFTMAASRYHIDASVLRAIAAVESGGNPYAINYNSNGSYDIGLMQINSSWLPRLSQYGITAEMLYRNPCVNIMTGAWILAKNIREHGYTWRAVGRYNAKSEEKMLRYAYRVRSALDRARQRRG